MMTNITKPMFGKICMVTGATSGIGEATVLGLTQRGTAVNAPLVSMRQIRGKLTMSVRSDHQKKIGREIDKFPTIDQIIKEKEEKDSEFESEMNRARLRVAIAMAIKIAREKAGLTQKELADALGMKQSQIARLESLKDKRLPSIDLLVKITNVTHRKIVVDQPLYRIELVAK